MVAVLICFELDFERINSNNVLHMTLLSYSCKMRCLLNLVLEIFKYLWLY